MSMRFWFAFVIAVSCMSHLTGLFAQGVKDPTPTAKPSSPAAASDSAVTEELARRVGKAIALYQEGKYEESLKTVESALKAHETHVELHNLRGAVLVKLQRWEEAIAMFRKVLELKPDHFPAKFNLGEVPFMRKQYPEARAQFLKLYEDNPSSELLVYKIFLSFLLEGNTGEASEWLKKLDFAGKTPAYYFAHAAWHFYFKKESEAQSYVASAVSIFPAMANNLFAETLVDLGWLQRRQTEPKS